MKKGLTYIAVVLDRSGSMSNNKSDTIGGFNTFLEQQQNAEGDALFTLAQFDSEYIVNYSSVKINEVVPLNNETYVPRAATALYDAIGRTINEVGAELGSMSEDERPETVSFVILTDGEENASKEFTKEQIFKMIKHQTDTYNWNFIYLGANQDAIGVGTSMGFSANTSATFSDGNYTKAWGAASTSTVNYRVSGNLGSATIDDMTRKSLVGD